MAEQNILTSKQITERTIRFYTKQHAEYKDRIQTFKTDQHLEWIYQLFEKYSDKLSQRKLLDLGCGTGYELSFFAKKGFDVVGLDGNPTFCRELSDEYPFPVLNQNLLKTQLPKDEFDVLFTQDTLFHLTDEMLLEILPRLLHSIREGALFCAVNPLGDLEEWDGSCYSHYRTLKAYQEIFSNYSLEILQSDAIEIGPPWADMPRSLFLMRKQHD